MLHVMVGWREIGFPSTEGLNPTSYLIQKLTNGVCRDNLRPKEALLDIAYLLIRPTLYYGTVNKLL